jgi:CRISPR-associated protein Cas2
MRRVYIVSYDISEPKRWRQVYRTMRRFGEHLHLSVFSCDLTPAQHIQMVAALEQGIDQETDQILLIDLGPLRAGRSKTSRLWAVRSRCGTVAPSSCDAVPMWSPRSGERYGAQASCRRARRTHEVPSRREVSALRRLTRVQACAARAGLDAYRSRCVRHVPVR